MCAPGRISPPPNAPNSASRRASLARREILKWRRWDGSDYLGRNAIGRELGLWADLAAWLQTRGPERTISPRSKVTLRQIAERERDFLPSGRESLESALRYDPTVSLARMMLANVLEKEELAKEAGQRDAAVHVRAAHWRRYDLDRLPQDDPQLWARAAEILRDAPEGAMVGVGPQPITAAAAAEQAERKATRRSSPPK
jgi:hypothetical protein